MEKIVIPSKDIVHILSQSDISFCKSDNCYTTFYLIKGEQIVMCKSLTLVMNLVDPTLFLRVNQSYLVNKNYIKLIDKKSKEVVLIDSIRIPFTIRISDIISFISRDNILSNDLI